MRFLVNLLFFAIWLDTAIANSTAVYSVETRSNDEQDRRNIQNLGQCKLLQRSGKQVTIKAPDHPRRKTFWKNIQPGSQLGGQNQYNPRQAWWTVDKPTDAAWSLVYLPDKEMTKEQKNGMTVDHVYELSILPQFFKTVFLQPQSETCKRFNDIFVDIEDATWTDRNGPFMINKQHQSRLQSLWNLLPNKLNLAFIGLVRDLNGMKAAIFNDNLWGHPKPNDDSDAKKNLDNWAYLGMTMQLLKQPVMQEQWHLVANAIMGGINQLDVLWTACEDSETPVVPLNLGPRYRQWVANLLSTNIASATSLASAYSNSIVQYATTTDKNGNKNSIYDSFTRLSKTYSPADMTFPLADYTIFPDATDGNIRRAAATVCPAHTAARPSFSSTVLATATSSSYSIESQTSSALSWVTSASHTPATSTATTTRSENTRITSPISSPSDVPSTLSTTLRSSPTSSSSAESGSSSTPSSSLTPSSSSASSSVPKATLPPSGSSLTTSSSPMTITSSVSSSTSIVATVTLGEVPVNIGMHTYLPELQESVVAALHAACPPPTQAGVMASCTVDTAVVPSVTWLSDNGPVDDGELELAIESSGYATDEQLAAFINSTATSIFAAAIKGLNCLNASWEQDIPEASDVLLHHFTSHERNETALECVASSAVTISTAIAGLGFETVITFAQKAANQFVCNIIVDTVQAGLDVITAPIEGPLAPAIAIGGSIAINQFRACCVNGCDDPIGVAKTIAGNLAPHISTMLEPVVSGIPRPAHARLGKVLPHGEHM